jgi:ferric-dicitrate binding protein FerR (iron transport regulator)
MEPSGSDLPESRVSELLARSIGGHLAPADESDARRAATALCGRPDGLELLREVVMEEGMLRTLLNRVHAEEGQEERVARSVGGTQRRAPFGPQWQHRDAAATRRRRMMRAAAIVLIGGGLGAVGVATRGMLHRGNHGAPAEFHTVATEPGQRASIDFPDGSRATLAPNTELRYAIAATSGVRDVQLDGEAYFEIHHDAARPFRVRTSHAVVEDLGTTFVVSDYAADVRARVAVRSGAVTLRARAAGDSSGVALRAGEVAGLDSSGTVVRLPGDPASYWAWTTGRLVFDRTPLPAVLVQLHRWYGVDFQLTDSTLAAQYFTGTFDSVSLPQVLDILGPLVHARFEHRGEAVLVKPRRGSP